MDDSAWCAVVRLRAASTEKGLMMKKEERRGQSEKLKTLLDYWEYCAARADTASERKRAMEQRSLLEKQKLSLEDQKEVDGESESEGKEVVIVEAGTRLSKEKDKQCESEKHKYKEAKGKETARHAA